MNIFFPTDAFHATLRSLQIYAEPDPLLTEYWITVVTISNDHYQKINGKIKGTDYKLIKSLFYDSRTY